MSPRTLSEHQCCEVWVADVGGGEPRCVHRTTARLLEAPNWTLDGRALVLNGDGRLWRFDLAEQSLSEIELVGVSALNNDHVLTPDGRGVLMSGEDGQLWSAPLTGGAGKAITAAPGARHYLHGVSPDGRTLAYVEMSMTEPSAPARLALISLEGTDRVLLETGVGHLDGPEFSPDGAWLQLNTEAFTEALGHAQLARLPVGGGPLERLHTSETVDWFPHLSPDGLLATYLEFPTGTLGHPADLDVQIVLVATSDWSTPLRRYPVFGGQGTLNVTSWSPDSTRFAFCAYPLSV